MRAWFLLGAFVVSIASIDAQTPTTTPRKNPQRATKKAPEPPLSRIQAEWRCVSELGVGVATGRRFCDVLTGNDPKEGVLITIPPHRGPVTMTFELHNRHTFSAELVKLKQAYRKYTATIGVLSMDNTLVDRAVVLSEFRNEKDLFDRISGGAGPGGVKAVAPSGNEMITMELPADIGDQVSVLGEKLTVVRPDGVDNFSSPGRPIATISNVMLEFRPGPPPKKTPAKKTPTKKP
ncbi:MAG TPA: hypothetical protein VFV51_02070 [Vicinamibacterales bacterium]|nr:hypothetical protein [Vicinamibacterales bacterium]